MYDKIDMKRERSEGFGDGISVGLALGFLSGLVIWWLIGYITVTQSIPQ